MKKKLMSLLAVGCAGACLLASSAALAEESYPDGLTAGPNIYTKQLENDRVRVSEIKFNPGDSIPMHVHIYDHFVYVLAAGQLTLSHPDGTQNVVDGKVGQIMWIPKETHAAVNTGSTIFRALVVEIKG